MLQIQELIDFPHIDYGEDLCEVIIENLKKNKFKLQENDILCIASKVVSISEERKICLKNVVPGRKAHEFYKRIPRKDPRVIQKIIDETRDPTGNRVEVSDNYIGAWLPNGLKLTSAGIDKIDDEHIILLPEDPDNSARKIGEAIRESFNVNVGVIITDSDGRIDKKGATQIAVGLYGVPAIRSTFIENKSCEETMCDMLAAASAIIMGQRGVNKPVVHIRGLEYEFDSNATIAMAINKTKNIRFK